MSNAPSTVESKTDDDAPSSKHALKTDTESNLGAAPSDVHEKTPKANRFNRKFLAICAAILAVLVVSGIVLGKDYFQKPDPSPAKTSTTSQNTNITVSTEPAKSAQDVIARVKAAFSKAPISNDPFGGPGPLRLEGYDFSVVPVITEQIAFSGTQKNALATYSTAKKILVGAGLKPVVVPDTYNYGAPSLRLDSTDVHCGLAIQPARKTATYVAGVGCLDTSDYEALAKKAQPFWNIFSVAAVPDQTKDSNATINGFETVPSKTPGYATASIHVVLVYISGPVKATGSVQLFYQTPDQVWHYFKSSQSRLSCDDYATTDLKKAFLGEACDSVGDGVYTQSTVQL
jgi:hypothetical protein